MKPSAKATPPAQVSAKKSAKERQALRRQQQQRQQTIILAIVAAAVVIGVIAVIGTSVAGTVLPKEAFVPDEAKTRYQEFFDKKLFGMTPEGYPFLGAENAPVLLEEFSSFSCPHCATYHTEYIANMLDLMKAGKLKYVFIPITSAGSFASEGMARGGICAAKQGKFGPMADTLFQWPTRYGTSSNDYGRMGIAAATLGINASDFNACLNDGATGAILDKAAALFTQRGLDSTPSIFVDGQQVQPAKAGAQTPNLSQMRGIIEQKAANKK